MGTIVTVPLAAVTMVVVRRTHGERSETEAPVDGLLRASEVSEA